MDRKGRLTKKELEYYSDNESDLELDDIVSEDDNDSSDYVPSENSSEDSDDEVVSEPEDNHDASQETTPNTNDNLWTENPQIPEQFIFQENIGLKLNTINLTVQTLVDLFFSQEFLALLVEQTNLYVAQE
ncbi:hypothetical protein EAI_07124, partial [Harpegnathos saltator]